VTPSNAFVELDRALHDRASFSCGKPSLDQFLKSQALQHKKAGTSTTLVLPGDEQGDDGKLPIIAFFAASFTSIERSTLPEKIQKTLPHYPVPAFLIAQLAVDERKAGEGYGGITLVNAIRYLCKVNESLPAVAIIVDCLDDDAQRFYEHFGFEFLCDIHERARLFLSMKTALAV